jgi:tetratricopeptide (TPR) repeat protein
VQKAGNQIRVTAQLINTVDGYHLWSKTFDRDLTDIFSVQDEIAEAVATALRKNLLGNDAASGAASSTTTRDFQAYNAYLLGLSFFHKLNQQDWSRAVEQFEIAIDQDPDMALAWAWLSMTISEQTGFGTEFEAGFERARAAAEKALQLDPNLADAHLALANVQIGYDWDWDGAEASLRRAFELRPGDPDIIAEIALLESIRGDDAEALRQVEQALPQDPLNVALGRLHIGVLARTGRLDEALAKGLFLANAMPDAGGIYSSIASVYRRLGQLDQALAAAKKEKFGFLRLQFEAALYHEMGDQETAVQKLQQLKDEYGDDASVQIANVYGAWGDREAAMAALERAYEVRDPGLVYMKRRTRTLDLLQDDPRYQELLRKMNLQ